MPCLRTLALCGLSAVLLIAQSQKNDSGSSGIFGGGSPILTGALGFTTDINNSSNLSFGPKFEPILLLPIGSRLLLETEFSTELPITRQDGALGPTVYNHSFEYLQLNYLASPNVVITGGDFVTPFGIYKERMDPQWVRNLLDPPLIFGISDNSSIGGMVRGSAYVADGVKLSGAAYYSVNSAYTQFQSNRQSGGTASIYLPGPRLEIGASYSRLLGDDRLNIAGADFVWNSRQAPLDVRGEYMYAQRLGSGYWVEAAYKLANVTSNSFWRKCQLVARGEQFFAPSTVAEDLDDPLPALSAKAGTVGLNYWPTDYLKASFSYGRESDSSGSTNTWTLGLVYRFTTGGR